MGRTISGLSQLDQIGLGRWLGPDVLRQHVFLRFCCFLIDAKRVPRRGEPGKFVTSAGGGRAKKAHPHFEQEAAQQWKGSGILNSSWFCLLRLSELRCPPSAARPFVRRLRRYCERRAHYPWKWGAGQMLVLRWSECMHPNVLRIKLHSGSLF